MIWNWLVFQGRIRLHTSVTWLVSLAQHVRRHVAKSNWGHDYASPILSAALIPLLSSSESFHFRRYILLEVEEVERRFLAPPVSSLGRTTFSLSHPLTARSARDRLVLTSQTKGSLAHLMPKRGGGRCTSPWRVLSVSFLWLTESHDEAGRSELEPRKRAALSPHIARCCVTCFMHQEEKAHSIWKEHSCTFEAIPISTLLYSLLVQNNALWGMHYNDAICMNSKPLSNKVHCTF